MKRSLTACFLVFTLLLFHKSVQGWPQIIEVPPTMSIRLIDVAQQAGIRVLNISGGSQKNYLLESVGNGVAWFDYNNDGLLDVLIVNGSTVEDLKGGGDPMVALYKNNGDGTFTDVTAPSGLIKKGWGMGVCVADYDNSGTEDVYVTAFGTSVLFRNNGDGTFTDMTLQSGVAITGWSTGCAFGDYDRDGYVDLYVARYVAFDVENTPKPGTGACQYMGMETFCGPRGLRGEPDVLFHNNGDGTFSNVTESAGIHDPGYYGFGVLFSDLDNDGWPDIYVANDSTPNFFFRNNQDGTFTEVGLAAGVALSGDGKAQAGMGVDAGDYNNDGYLGIFVTHFSQDYGTLYRNNHDGTFNDVSYQAGVASATLNYLGWGTGFADLDNDGYLDLFVANGHIYPQIDQFPLNTTYRERFQVFQNIRNGRFREVTQEVEAGPLHRKSSRGAAFGDFDNDGDLDVLLVNINDRPTLLRNDGANKNHWLTLRLVGTRSNRDAIGARVRLETSKTTQSAEVRSGGSYISQNDVRLHFGLGQDARVKRLDVRWPSGLVEKFENVSGDQFLLITEGQGMTKARAPSVPPKHL